MKYIIYSRFGHIQGIVKDENDVFFTCNIKTTGVGQNPIHRFDTYKEAEKALDDHFKHIAKVKFAGLVEDTIGDLD